MTTPEEHLIRGAELQIEKLKRQLETAPEPDKPRIQEEIEFQSQLLESLKDPSPSDDEPSMVAFVTVLAEAAGANPRDLPALAEKAKVLYDRLDPPNEEKHGDATQAEKFRALAGGLAFRLGAPDLAEGARRISMELFGSSE